MEEIRLLIDPPGDPFTNMARDEELADRVRRTLSPAILRIYQWDRPAISLGRRQTSGDLPTELITRNLPIVHRPTGGGAVVHTLEEVTYSLSISRGSINMPVKELPLLFHQLLKEALMEEGIVLASVRPERSPRQSANELWRRRVRHVLWRRRVNQRTPTLCFASPVRGDLLFRGRKVAGSALRAWKDGILIQGSLQGLPVSYNKSAETVLLAARRLLKQHEENLLAPSHCCRG